MYREDPEAWLECPDRHRWVFNKLEVARRSGHACGPKGVPVPKPGKYIVRPMINLLGMGRGAKIVQLDKCTLSLPDGYFWCEVFTGRHLSVDYKCTSQVLCVEGFRSPDAPLWKWSKWVRTEDDVPLPDIALPLLSNHSYFNVEYIGGKVIEIHLRHNPDWRYHSAREITPVFKGEPVDLPDNSYFLRSPDFERLGFILSSSR